MTSNPDSPQPPEGEAQAGMPWWAKLLIGIGAVVVIGFALVFGSCLLLVSRH